MNIKTAYCQSSSIFDAAEKLKIEFRDFKPRLLIVFASSRYDPVLLNQALQETFPGVEIIGCSTAGEIVTNYVLEGTIVAMALNENIISDVYVEVIPNLSTNLDVKSVIQNFDQHFGIRLDQLDYRKYVGLLLIDGLSMMEEKLIESLGDKTNLMIVGGSAGDDLKFEKTFVYAHGNAYSNAAILVVLKPTNGFDILKTQSFYPSNFQLTPTKVEQSTRTVLEFNYKPAAQVYADALGVTLENLPSLFMKNPLGLMADGEPYVRSPQKITGQGLTFYCQVVENVPLTILNPLDIVEDTKKALLAKQVEIGSIQAIVDFHCILRTLQLREQGKTDAYAKLFGDIPLIGFSTYGEAYLGHMNQTSTMLILK